MAKKFGNDYRFWVKTTGETPEFVHVKGQTSTKVSRQGSEVDTSSKDDYPYGTSGGGTKKVTLTLQIFSDLPDTGFETLEDASKSLTSEPIEVQIRKGGAAGGESDIVWHAIMNMTQFDTDYPLNGVVTCDFQLTLAAAPIVDKLA